MRDIEFRGKAIATGEWKYGFIYLWHDASGKEFYNILNESENIKVNLEFGLTGEVPALTQIIDSTIGQFTGQYDIKGNKVFEGDILKHDAYWEGDCHYPAGKGQVLWDDEDTGFYLTSSSTSYVSLFNLTRNLNAEVIGNIYDNPELLEGGN